MPTPTIIKIILIDGRCQRLTFPCGLPESVTDLLNDVKKQCGLHGNFSLQFMDPIFGN
ncbi:unnamed protein product, partial [Oncorhynchus mykiss]